MSEPDVPSPIDLCDPADAREWARTAQARPGRQDVFRALGAELAHLAGDDLRVLELGSGPGFLALALLDALPSISLTLLDFSAAMHALARARLGDRAGRVHFVERDFRLPTWSEGLGPYDAVITQQAVHELRHKRHAESLHAGVKGVLKPQAPYLVCDHYYGDGGMTNDRLYMSIEEQRHALERAGFTRIERIVRAGSLVLHRAEAPSSAAPVA